MLETVAVGKPVLLRNPWFTFAIFCGALISLTLVGEIIYDHARRLGDDFLVFWLAAREPLSQVYAPRFAPFVYPPPALVLFRGLAVIPFWPAFAAWSLGGLILYWRAARTSPLILASPVVAQCIVFGQTALILGAVVNFASRANPVVRGAMLGCVFALKPQLVVFAPLVLLVRRDWRGIVGFAYGALGLVILSLAAVGPGAWLNWLHALPAFRQTLADRDLWSVVVTPYSYAVQLGINPWPVFIACLGIALAAIWWHAKSADPVELICLTSLLASPYAGGSDIAALLPFAFRRLADVREPLKIWTAFIYAAAFTPIALLVGLYRLLHQGHAAPAASAANVAQDFDRERRNAAKGSARR